ncbi:MAG: putative C-S lyase [Ruminococcaceae bacterium]|nr:putative C-S lyase [Oscillospiraceae bacterium]
MKYDFENLHPAYGTNLPMWDRLSKFAPLSSDEIDFGVAEMKFHIASEISSALTEYIKNGTFGYSGPPADFSDSICNWMSNNHSWKISPDWITQTYGLEQAIGFAITALSKESDGVLVCFPTYYPFVRTVSGRKRKLVRSDLILKNGRYEFDFEDIESKIISENVRVFILCSPHNPVGRVWEKSELNKIGSICKRHGVYVVSDEIHSDICFGSNEYTVFSEAGEGFREFSAILTAPSKTFNIAGLTVSNTIIANDNIRSRFREVVTSELGQYTNAIGYAACTAAYNNGSAWLNECLKVLEYNCNYFRNFVNINIPDFHVNVQEGTYLVWLDCRKTGITGDSLEDFLHNKAKFYTQRGDSFGEGFEGFHRVNLACPTEYVIKAAQRLKAAYNESCCI